MGAPFRCLIWQFGEYIPYGATAVFLGLFIFLIVAFTTAAVGKAEMALAIAGMGSMLFPATITWELMMLFFNTCTKSGAAHIPEMAYWSASAAAVMLACIIPTVNNSLYSWIFLAFLYAQCAVFAPFYILVAVLLYLGVPFFNHRTPDPNDSRTQTSAESPMHIDVINNERLDAHWTLSVGMCPGRKKGVHLRDCAKDIQDLAKDHNVTHVLTLMPLDELKLVVNGQTTIREECIRNGIHWMHLPIRDKFIPADSVKFSVMLSTVAFMLRRNRVADARGGFRPVHLYVHCNGGKGRSGTVVACLIAAVLGGDYTDIGLLTEVMRNARPGMLRNPLQRMFVRYFLNMTPLPFTTPQERAEKKEGKSE